MSELFFSQTHQWVALVEGNRVHIGISQYAEEALGDIVYVELPEAGKQVVANELLGTIESVKTASEILSPVTGTLVACNELLDEEPEKLNEQPLKTWIYLLEVDAETLAREQQQLLTASAYQQHLEQL